MPREPSCLCGDCQRCKHRVYMREWYQRKTMQERRDWIAKRDPEKTKANDRARFQRDKEKRIAATKAYISTPEGRESKHRTQKRWRSENPEKVRAHKAVRRAIDKGELVRQPCSCGEPKSEAHHDDYSKPLEVRWLCRRCHHRTHFIPF